MIETHMFWAYGNIGKIEILSMNSFLDLGYVLNVWSYGQIPDLPGGARTRDAREIIGETHVFLNKAGSYASFADWFRYSVLHRHGGLWADTDVIALIGPDELPKTKFLVAERVFGGRRYVINNNVIYLPSPSPGDLIDLALGYCERFEKDRIAWGEIGPSLLTAIVLINPDHGFDIQHPNFANPIDAWDCPGALFDPRVKLPFRAAFLHCYTSNWTSKGFERNAPFPKACLMDMVSRPDAAALDSMGKSVPAPLAFTSVDQVIGMPPRATPRPWLKPGAELLLTLGRASRVKKITQAGAWLWTF